MSLNYLLDVNTLLTAIWSTHPQHETTFNWLAGKKVTVCPLAELGFLRISSNAKAINVPMEKARRALNLFLTERQAKRIPDDLPALESSPQKSDEVTDSYLADLAARHGLKLATLDHRIKHPAVVLVG